MNRQYMQKIKNTGFTIIEIMVSMVISSFVIAGIYGIYTIQQKSYTAQEQITEIQQRIRSAMDFMTRDIRMINYYDPKKNCRAKGIQSSIDDLSNSLESPLLFDYCDKDGKLNTISYQMNDTNLVRNLSEQDPPGLGLSESIAENVDAINFQYLDSNGIATTVPANIRSIRISMLVRSTYPDPKHIDTALYPPWNTPFNDNYHRRLLVTTIRLRNPIKS